MATSFYRGSTPTVRFYPQGISVTDASLGDPTVAIEQELAFLVFDGERVAADSSRNCISVTLTEDETLQLADGVATTAQLSFTNVEAETVVKFPTHDLTVLPSILDATMTDEEIEEIENAPDDDTPVEDEVVMEDPIGTVMDDPDEDEDYVLDDFIEYYDEDEDAELDFEEFENLDPDEVEAADEEE